MRRLITPVAGAVWVLLSLMSLDASAQAQTSAEAAAAAEPTGTLPAVRVRAAAEREPKASISGLDPRTPAWQTPLQAQRFDQSVLKDAQVQRLADLVKLDASTSDAYNTTGYWDSLTVRGFVLDNAYNFRREGLPINAETRLPLDNKSGVEVFKGTSGIQAGVSSPGGLVNLLVKRPEGRVRHAELGLTGGSSVLAAVDLGDRFGADQRFGLRVNAATERLAPDIDNTRGQRHLLAVATDWVLAPGSVIEAEFEHSRQRQPTVPGASLTGATLPSADDFSPSRNLNDQPWTLPVELQGNTGSLRWKQAWGQGWASTVSYGEQHLRSEDRAAFPSGCSAVEQYDRYCADGSFDLYDYRSEGESRLTRALNLQLTGDAVTGEIKHALSLGLLRALHHTDLDTAAFNYVGEGRLSGGIPAYPESTEPTYPGLDRHERSTELSVSDALTFNEQWRAWGGLRHTRLDRSTELSTGSDVPISLSQSVTTSWLAIGYTLAPRTQAYASWGEGFEARVSPSNPVMRYANESDVLPVRKSRQLEVGLKGQGEHQGWGINGFRIQRPTADALPAATPDPARPGGDFVWDGQARHDGLEGYWHAQAGRWTVYTSAMVIDAKRRGSQLPGVNGKRPVNVPEHTLKLSTTYKLPLALPVTLQGDLIHEGRRWADRDNTVRLPSWTRVDVGIKAVQRLDHQGGITWRLGVANLFDKRAWRESPTLTGHIYLFPLAERTVTASAQIDF
ncbi:MAG: TonB-dependent receptor [Rubrivivax sp.]|nr:MAG: TonB-dependent receptor [Rubrivivax sp.]